ncbi:Trp biosynthesis-associated membrane protein [Agrococcus carbonis]|uniref:Tryptophan-associated transmembrane protein (Trp_oprn_chp) n=1 Tax=Agrococcus carbonis TaxID=684552 RepID=A0A1H1KWW0_9MICO|nr:Trp biosynthesis-associated membrane protein [Agrococcus carbonis]SDR66794.1 Tryptophan-associated transmembrane protein (Trp_oprn_chp) [Agrococcus carbonis]
MSRLLARGRTVASALLLLAAALGLLSATQPWASVVLVDGRELAATGQQLAGALTVMALACAVLALVLPLAGRAWRVVLGVLALALGAGLIAHVSAAQGGIGRALDVLVADATGIAGSAQAAEVASLVADGWQGAGFAAGAVAAIAGAWTLATGHRWPARAKRAARYERTGSGLAWDAMDDGEDPTR